MTGSFRSYEFLSFKMTMCVRPMKGKSEFVCVSVLTHLGGSTMISIRTLASSFLLTKPINSSASSASTSTTGRGRESVSRSCVSVFVCVVVIKAGRERHRNMSVTFLCFFFCITYCLCLHTHLSSSVGIITDIKDNSLSSFVQCHASLKETTQQRQQRGHV